MEVGSTIHVMRVIFAKTCRFWTILGTALSACFSGLGQVTPMPTKVRLSRHVNTAAHEYLPCPCPDGTTMYFAGMDRTGFFDFKLDFIEQANSGGEDIFVTQFNRGLWSDAKPVQALNTRGHETVTQCTKAGLLISANYPENLGLRDETDGLQSEDLFEIKNPNSDAPRILHLPEPVNSIYNEFDGWRWGDALLFTSDRPGATGEYHLKGWKWNGHYWGNTDVYVAFQGDFGWERVVKLPDGINTPNAERTPRLSEDGKTLWLSRMTASQGMEILSFTREDTRDWETWNGPFVVSHANTAGDDWGYVETGQHRAFWGSALPLSFQPTMPAYGGDAGSFRETNYRTGYTIVGRQTASLLRTTQSDIFTASTHGLPDVVLEDVLFQHASSDLQPTATETLLRLVDLCLMNRASTLRLVGHTDNSGTDDFNLQLSLDRAQEVKAFLLSNGATNTIEVEGKGESQPLNDNSNEDKRRYNRRVEIFIAPGNS